LDDDLGVSGGQVPEIAYVPGQDHPATATDGFGDNEGIDGSVASSGAE
jgi:hypothetical protein